VDRRAPRAARVHPPIAHTGPAEERKLVAPGRDVVCRVGNGYERNRRLADELARQRLGGLHSARSMPVSVDFANIEPLQVNGAWDEAGARLARPARQVEALLTLIATDRGRRAAAEDVPGDRTDQGDGTTMSRVRR